ncbi:hypothetical protein F5Y19DRAFT_486283 [Xylariaceae sp. FL1651]|nr:hypothetical protein F5Y19DRAFT_486283 [Xylariaceae sp. FL1651]
MAPYTMKINIQNPEIDVAYIGSARLKGYGYVTTTGTNVAAGSTSEGASLTKGGGTEGLFIATLFSVSECSENLLVWSSMSAASDGEVMVQIAFIDPNLSITSLPDTCYYEPNKLGLTTDVSSTRGKSSSRAMTSLMAKLEHYDRTYPNSTCTVSVVALLTGFSASGRIQP